MRVLLFGATGMVGRGVLRECLRDDRVNGVLAAEFRGYDACFFCLGVSAAGMSEADYTRLTFDLTLAWARTLAEVEPAMTFVYDVAVSD